MSLPLVIAGILLAFFVAMAVWWNAFGARRESFFARITDDDQYATFQECSKLYGPDENDPDTLNTWQYDPESTLVHYKIFKKQLPCDVE